MKINKTKGLNGICTFIPNLAEFTFLHWETKEYARRE